MSKTQTSNSHHANVLFCIHRLMMMTTTFHCNEWKEERNVIGHFCRPPHQHHHRFRHLAQLWSHHYRHRQCYHCHHHQFPLKWIHQHLQRQNQSRPLCHHQSHYHLHHQRLRFKLWNKRILPLLQTIWPIRPCCVVKIPVGTPEYAQNARENSIMNSTKKDTWTMITKRKIHY